MGCDDGALRIYSFDENDRLYISKTTRNHKEKCLSVCFDSVDENIVYGGFDRGVWRKFEVSTNRVLSVVKAGKGSSLSENNIWAICHTDPKFLVLGFSSGFISIYETTFGTLVTEFKEHIADILCFIVSHDGSTIFASGADSLVVTISKKNLAPPAQAGIENELESSEADVGNYEFSLSSKDRGQSHDVYALELFHNDLLASGGVTTDICLYKLENGRLVNRHLNMAHRNGGQVEKSKEGIVKLRHITSLPLQKEVLVNTKKEWIFQGNDQELNLFDYKSDQFNFLLQIKMNSTPIQAFAIGDKNNCIAYSILGATQIIFLKENQENSLDVKAKNKELPFGCLGMKFVNNL